MDYRDFTPRQEAFDGFVKLRRQVYESVNRGDDEALAELYANAVAGDCVAQDVVAYFFSKGLTGVLPENYVLYMSWQILAGANGNEFALEKLEFALNPALAPIVNEEEVLTTAMRNRLIDKNNALMVISNLICEAVVDDLKIDPKNMISFENKNRPYTPRDNRMFMDAIENSIAKVVQFLMS